MPPVQPGVTYEPESSYNPICPSLRGWPAPGTAALSGFPPTARVAHEPADLNLLALPPSSNAMRRHRIAVCTAADATTQATPKERTDLDDLPHGRACLLIRELPKSAAEAGTEDQEPVL